MKICEYNLIKSKLISFWNELEDHFWKGIKELESKRDNVKYQHLFVLSDNPLNPNKLSENSKLKIKNRFGRFLINEYNKLSKMEISKIVEENWLFYRLVFTRYNQQINYTDELWERVQPFLMNQLFYFDVEKILAKSENQIFMKVHSSKSEKFRYYKNNKKKEEKWDKGFYTMARIIKEWKSRGSIISSNISLDYNNNQNYFEYYKKFANAEYKINKCLDRKKLLYKCRRGEIFSHEDNLKVTGLGEALFADFFKEVGYIQFIKPDIRIKEAISENGILAKNNLLNDLIKELERNYNFILPKTKEWKAFIIIDYLTYKLLQLYYEKKFQIFPSHYAIDKLIWFFNQ